ncbi:MAG TPA: hypothetical protein VEF03_08295, partial [Candidatus Binataceae bacterium]|nr:hypothetical protein [Candidatus Binataceae bacterium]
SAPIGMSLVGTPDNGPRQYSIYATEQATKGDTGEAVCPNAEGFFWVAAQVALRRNATTASASNH